VLGLRLGLGSGIGNLMESVLGFCIIVLIQVGNSIFEFRFKFSHTKFIFEFCMRKLCPTR